MTHRIRRRRFAFGRIPISFAVFAAMSGFFAPLQADVLILKDGYAIHGKIGDEKTAIFDAGTGQEIIVKKANGFSMVDDGARFTIFSSQFKALGDVNDFNKFQEYVRLVHTKYPVSAYPLRKVMIFRDQTEFGADWRRVLTFGTDEPAPVKIVQQLVVLTPHYAQIDSTTHLWRCFYLTRELGFERVRKLLATHPELIETKGPDVDKRTKIIRFLIQADWLKEAEQEIDLLAKDLPSETKRIESLRQDVRDIRQERLVADVERAKESGRHGYALATLKRLPAGAELPRKLADKVLAIKVEYEAAVQKFEDAKRYLESLREGMQGANAPLGAALKEILNEIHLDTVNRLDTFITLAAQSERDLKAGKKPLYKPEEIVAAGISSWLQGQNSAQTKVDFARKLLFARDTALKYLRTDVGGKRKAMLDDYEKDTLALPYDELEKLISLLPPPIAEAKTPTQAVLQKTEPIPVLGEAVKYTLQLPPEYQHGRPYPLLIVLPSAGQKPQDILDKLGDFAAKHGYVVAVVDWGTFHEAYSQASEEIAVVTGLLRHMRRAFQIDSDRVFLMGYGEGASLAMEVAAGHPDLFAGIVPMCPIPSHQFLILGKYWTNFQNLPVYLVMGDRAGETIRTVRAVYTEWMKLGYPALCISYKGRGNDKFDEELPYIFDWMSRKTRATAVPAVGSEVYPYHTMRSCDNRFYWLSTEDVARPYQVTDAMKNNAKSGPAHLTARIMEGNLIVVHVLGLNQLTLWIGKGMIDFAKPVTVKVDQKEVFKKLLTAKISVLLEDLYERGDRQRPALQRIDLFNFNRVIKATSP